MSCLNPPSQTTDLPRDEEAMELRQRAECLTQVESAAFPKDFSSLSPATLRKTLHELRVYQIALEMQYVELRRSQAELDTSRANFFDFYDRAPVGYCTIGEHGLILQANLTAASLLGVMRSALVKRPFSHFILKAHQDLYYLFQKQTLAASDMRACELQMVKNDGTPFWARLEAIAMEDVAGTPQLRVVLSDISERKQTEDEMRVAAVAFASQSGMLISDPQGVILRVNPAFTRLTGYSAEEAIGKTTKLLKSGHHEPHFYQQMWGMLQEKGFWQGEILNRHKEGQLFSALMTITAVSTPERGITHYVSSFIDITEDKETEAAIHRLAYYDPLTGLPNRRMLYDRLGQTLASTGRSGRYGAVFFIDVDNFKALNDTRGHDAGDQLLIGIAQRLQGIVREGDTVARQGSDEFVVLLEDLGAEVDAAATLAKHLGDKLNAAINQRFILNEHSYQCRISVGVSLFHELLTVQDLLKQADLALNQAKNAGRNCLHFFDPAMQAALDLRSALESELQTALQLDQLQLYYQPQVDAACRVTGVEALLRWQHPQRGLVPPMAFIAIAEDTGLILPIGLWVLQTACAQLKTWATDANTCALQVGVNVSARQFRQAEFVAQVQAVIQASGINPARLQLELTESMVLEDIDDTIVKMLAIKKLGVSFSMDDFGTGYSSLSYLAQLPLDQLKIDQSFVRHLPGSAKAEPIVRAIITLGQGLNMNVIAEGVETREQYQFLMTQGCQNFQGYFFGRPMPIADVNLFLNKN